MRNSILFFLFTCAFCFYGTKVLGQIKSTERGFGDVNTVQSAVPFLTISPDARAGSMGDAGVASSPDGASIHWNVAKLAFLERNTGGSISYIPWLRNLVPDINLTYLALYKRLDDVQSVGGSLRFFSLGDIVFTDIQGTEVGQHNPNELALDGGYARRLSDNLSLGMAGRFIYSNLTGNYNTQEYRPGVSGAADVGVYYQKEIELQGRDAEYAWGVQVSNIGSKITYTNSEKRDFIPTNLRYGGRLNVHLDDYNEVAFLMDLNKLMVPTNPEKDSSGNITRGRDPNRSVPSGMFGSFYDAPGGLEEEVQEFTFSTGAEYWYDKQFAVRGGYFYEHPLKGNRQFFTLGAAIKFNVFQLDFAYLIPTEQQHPLQNTLRFTLGMDLTKGK